VEQVASQVLVVLAVTVTLAPHLLVKVVLMAVPVATLA
jgi:hypothetical protein